MCKVNANRLNIKIFCPLFVTTLAIKSPAEASKTPILHQSKRKNIDLLSFIAQKVVILQPTYFISLNKIRL